MHKNVCTDMQTGTVHKAAHTDTCVYLDPQHVIYLRTYEHTHTQRPARAPKSLKIGARLTMKLLLPRTLSSPPRPVLPAAINTAQTQVQRNPSLLRQTLLSRRFHQDDLPRGLLLHLREAPSTEHGGATCSVSHTPSKASRSLQHFLEVSV